MGRAGGDVFDKLCLGEFVDSVKGFSIMVDNNAEDTIGPAFLEWVRDYLKHGLCFFISKTAAAR
jgi:hypothetical protein